MMTQMGTDRESFHARVQALYEGVDKSDVLGKIRAKAWDHFLELGLPSRHAETYRLVPLRHLYKGVYALLENSEPSPEKLSLAEVQPHIYPECAQSVLVFVNGSYVEALSNTTALPKQMVVTSLSTAARTYNALLGNRWGKSLMEETDPFAVLNAALHGVGGFVYLPPKTVLKSPLQILHIVDPARAGLLGAFMPRVHFYVGSQSQLKVLSTAATLSGEDYWVNQVHEFVIEEAAHVHYTNLVQEVPQAWHAQAFRAVLKRDSTLTTVAVTDGSKSVRHDYYITLAGTNCEASLYGAWVLRGVKQAHVNIVMEHQQPHCKSTQCFKGVLHDVSRSSFEGKILVRQAAQKTEAYQVNNNLVLSDKAIADSKPNLEIFADDVKATHGATVGRLDEEQLFYLRTRGFSLEAARETLLKGFYNEIIDRIPIHSVRQQAQRIAN